MACRVGCLRRRVETGGIAPVADGPSAGSERSRRCHLSVRTRVGGARRGEEWSSPASQVVSSRTAAMAPCGFDLNPHSSEPAYATPRIGAVGRCCQGETRGDFGDCMNTIHRDTRARRSQYRDFGYPHTLVKDTPSCHCTCRCREACPVQAGSIILLPLRVQLSIRRRSGLEPAMRWGRSWQGRARGPLSL